MKTIVKAIETNDGYFVNKKYYFYNGAQPEETFDCDWGFVPKTEKPLLIEEKTNTESFNHRLELFDKTLANDKIPLTLKAEQNDDYEWEPYDKEYKNLSSLYRLVCDTKPERFEVADVDFQIILKVPIINNPERFEFRVASTYNRIGTVTGDSFESSTLDKIMFPRIIRHQLPLRADSKLVYDILRQYIIDNIDNKEATITSNFDFCFAVEKKIKLTKIEEFVRTITKGSGRRQKTTKEKCFVTNRTKKVFEMTYSPKNYESYTPIQPLEGLNANDLRDKIIKLCEETISKINKPMQDCPHCEGKGVI